MTASPLGTKFTILFPISVNLNEVGFLHSDLVSLEKSSENDDTPSIHGTKHSWGSGAALKQIAVSRL